ncbi:16S rRNA (guanine(966)-N(2))-methyltransferase RsmD [Sneathiella marina]|uniref:16S rRNA (Guanine(966)-N(2))-methyltransferase RsmD n=1 Tax=Sneathiella marina TaxID=2950108 RepID=A0ABY4W4K2_9PROT|nr:16S rRNA (guanine(966)-N(2))-methyltransferase RsmD [Sneathiella marina]USG62136.1 16S rRNA (guanine(966)-N(2))-methyltransferase RsmD [Sneathiella marina]
MRIVGGEFRGKKLILPTDQRIRPTSDRTREALFNILGHDSNCRTDSGPLPLGVRVLDIFAGTGALGLEALSRGASHVTFVDNHPDSQKLLRENVRHFNVGRSADILQRDGTDPGQPGTPYDLVLMDPPYNQNLAGPCVRSLLTNNWLQDGAVLAIELAAKEKYTPPDEFSVLKDRKYGAARLIFLKLT